MKSLPVDTSALRFLVTSDPRPALHFETKEPKRTFDGRPIFEVELLASGDGRKSEVFTVQVFDKAPAVSEGNRVRVGGLIGKIWEKDGKSGVKFSAAAIEPVSANTTKAA